MDGGMGMGMGRGNGECGHGISQVLTKMKVAQLQNVDAHYTEFAFSGKQREQRKQRRRLRKKCT